MIINIKRKIAMITKTCLKQTSLEIVKRKNLIDEHSVIIKAILFYYI